MSELPTDAIEECISFAHDNCPIESFAPKADDQLQALLDDRDRLQLKVQRLTDELYLAHEALKREFVRNGIKEVTE